MGENELIEVGAAAGSVGPGVGAMPLEVVQTASAEFALGLQMLKLGSLGSLCVQL